MSFSIDSSNVIAIEKFSESSTAVLLAGLNQLKKGFTSFMTRNEPKPCNNCYTQVSKETHNCPSCGV